MVGSSELSSLELVPQLLLDESDESRVFRRRRRRLPGLSFCFLSGLLLTPLLLLPLSPCPILQIMFTLFLHTHDDAPNTTCP